MTESSNKHPHVSLIHQSVAAAGASIVSAIVVNPLDVVKVCCSMTYHTCGCFHMDHPLFSQTRIQAQQSLRSISETVPSSGSYIQGKSLLVSQEARHQPSPRFYKGTYDALKRIAQDEGVRALWRGTGLSLTMAAPMVGIYLPLYDVILRSFEEKQHMQEPYAPLLAGTVARSIAVYCTSPIELMKVRVQAFMTPQVNDGCSTKSLRQLWRGVGATLWRDVPFSGIYWALVEPMRRQLTPIGGPTSEIEVLKANALSGAASGALAAAITTPFYVAKTRMQLYPSKTKFKTFCVMKDVVLHQGFGGLFKGWSARSAKAIPACAIVLSSYEMIKFFPFFDS